jgi:TRAP-type mannitol/chloroaromatic compound transport system substrate-binding protein
MCFSRPPPARAQVLPLLSASNSLPDNIEAAVMDNVNLVLSDLIGKANELYPQAYLAQLFKNQTKLGEIMSAILAAKLSDSQLTLNLKATI